MSVDLGRFLKGCVPWEEASGLYAGVAQSQAPARIRLDDLVFARFVAPQGEELTGNWVLARLIAAGCLLVDAGFLEPLLMPPWEALERLHEECGVRQFELPGSIVRSPRGTRCFAQLTRLSHGWCATYRDLDLHRRTEDLFAIIPKDAPQPSGAS